MIIELNNQNFSKETEKGLKLIEFYTSWCGFCKKQDSELNEMDKIWIGKVNAEKENLIAGKYNINAFPTFLILKDGQEISRFSGYHKKEAMMNKILEYLK